MKDGWADDERTDRQMVARKNNTALAHLYHGDGGGGWGNRWWSHIASLVEFCPMV